MFENIKEDIFRYLNIDGQENCSIMGKIFVFFFAYGLHSTIVYRYGNFIRRRIKKNLFIPIYWALNIPYLVFYFFCKKAYGIDISADAEIGKGFYIGHFGGIEISNCFIGYCCNVHQLTKIREKAVVGNFVWVGSHATVESGAIIEDHATVDVFAKVNNNVKTFHLVSGNPAKTIKINFDNSGMLGLGKGHKNR